MTKVTHAASADADFAAVEGCVYTGATAKLYVGNKANNVRIHFDGETASAQQWAGESAGELQTFDIGSATTALELLTECRKAVNAENGQIRVPTDSALIHFKTTGEHNGKEAVLDLGKSGARFLTVLQAMAEEEERASEELAAALEAQSNSDAGNTASVEEQADQLKGVLKQAVVTATPGSRTSATATVKGTVADVDHDQAGLSPDDVAEAGHEILGLHAEGDEHGWAFNAKPTVVDRFAFPEGTIFNGVLEVKLPGELGTEVYSFDAEDNSVNVNVTIPAAEGADEEAEGREYDIETLTQVGAANRLLTLINQYGEDLSFQMVENLDLNVPALELEYSYHPEKKGKVTVAVRRELGGMFANDLQALAVPTTSEMSLFDRTEFTYEEFEHVAQAYASELSKRCSVSAPASVISRAMKLTGWVSLVMPDEDTHAFLLNGDHALDEEGQRFTMFYALQAMLDADKITILPDSRLAEPLRRKAAADSANKGSLKMDMKAMTGVMVEVDKEDVSFIHTTTGLKSLFNRIYTESTALLSVEVGKLNTLIDTNLSVVASELLVDVNSK